MLGVFQISMQPYEKLCSKLQEEDYIVCVDSQKHSGNTTDFILALIEVEVAVVFSYREDGIKFSVRSEDPEIHAGNLIHDALKGIGNGGGHAAMAGGLIQKDQEHLLGRYPKESIRDLFLKVLEKKEV